MPPNYWTMYVGPRTDAIQCIDRVRFWVFMAAPTGEGGSWSHVDALIKPATDWRNQRKLRQYIMAAPMQTLLARYNASKSRMLCEIFLKEPTWPKGAEKLQGTFDVSGSWIFPVDYVGGAIVRRPGELGEVPDWKWLFKAHEKTGRYPKRTTAIKVKTK